MSVEADEVIGVCEDLEELFEQLPDRYQNNWRQQKEDIVNSIRDGANSHGKCTDKQWELLMKIDGEVRDAVG